jgi:hypothetical protein
MDSRQRNLPLDWRAPPKAANAKRDLHRRPQLEELEDRDTPSIVFMNRLSGFTIFESPIYEVMALNNATGNYRYIMGMMPGLMRWAQPTQITEGADGVLYASFPSYTPQPGLYCYDYNVGSNGWWTQISPVTPRAMDASADNTLVASFDYYGTWEYHGTSGYWTLMTPSTALSVAAARNDQAYASFAAAGTFEYLNGSWYWLTPATTTTLAASQNGVGFASFYGGTWEFSNYYGWKLLAQQSTALAASYDPATDYTYLCGSFYGAGTYQTNVTLGTWSYLRSELTSQLGYDDLHYIYAVYGSGLGSGLWKWINGSWTQIAVADLLAA